MNALNEMVEFAICVTYEKEGMDAALKMIEDKEHFRQKSLKDLKEIFNDYDFEIGYANVVLNIINTLLKTKKLKENKEDLKVLANKLIEIANNLREL